MSLSRGIGLLCVTWIGFVGAQEPAVSSESGAPGRLQLTERVQRAFASQQPAKPTTLTDSERQFGLDLRVVEGRGLRVLTTGEVEEALRAASTIGAARALFAELTGLPALFPSGLSAYLIGSSEAKQAFLQHHPKLSPETRASFARLEGSGIPGTADWAYWDGDAEKRLDAMVRFSFDWLFRAQRVTTEKQTWLHEGLGFYLTHALVGTRLMWFVPPAPGSSKASGRNILLRAQMEEPGADWLELAQQLFAPEEKFDFEELLHLGPREFEAVDYLRVHALAAFLVETRPATLGTIVTKVGADEDPRAVLEEAVGLPFEELRGHLHAWLALRQVHVARELGLRTPEELEGLWRTLSRPQRIQAMATFQAGLETLDTLQLRCLRAALGAAPAPLALEEPPFFDPKVHAPSQVIPRKRLSRADSRSKRVLARLHKEPDPRALELAYDYDWGRAGVVTVGDPTEVELLFRNALRGLPPAADRARAQVLAALDRADERKLQAAFAHAYTDREGNVYPATLFEMWATGDTLEMPDVDTLGIVHEVLDDWRRWTAPVPGAQHDALYGVIGELFSNARRSRELRASLAELFLFPAAPARAGYESLALNLQALWASVESDPTRLAEVLPDGKGWEKFLAELVQRCKQDYKYFQAGRRRAAQLRKDSAALWKLLGAAMDQAAAAAPSEPEGEQETQR